jgi:hypothetical protein
VPGGDRAELGHHDQVSGGTGGGSGHGTGEVRPGPPAPAMPEEAVMARTSTRRRKGCGLCKPWKHAGHGDSFRQPPRAQRQYGSSRRWNRHDLPGNE